MKKPDISVVAPLYNEEKVFGALVQRLDELMNQWPWKVEIVLVDDGSRDQTREMMQAKALSDARYHCVFLARNFGHQTALTAGMARARGSEGIFVIDGDLQDPPELLEDFYAKFREGYDVVYGVRQKRKENHVKRFSYFMFYFLLDKISLIPMPKHSGDFCFVSRRVVDILNQMPEENRFIRGMRSWVGFRQYPFEYERSARFAGAPKYTYKELFRLAYNGIFNFSDYPIKFLTRLGGLAFGIAVVYFLITLVKKFFFDAVPEGFTALLFMIIFFGGLNLIAIGILGEYLIRIFFQVKGRPLFVIADEIRDGASIDASAYRPEKTASVHG